MVNDAVQKPDYRERCGKAERMGTMSSLIRFLLGATMLAGFQLGAAHAADYDAPIFVENAPEYVPVEVGNGWYLRGDVGYQFENSYEDNFFGVVPGANSSEDEFPASFSIGMGYRFNDFLRVDATVGYLSGSDASLNYTTALPSAVSASVENRMYNAMLNGYVDLGTFAGLTPYIGGGVGIVWNRRSYSFSEDFADPMLADTEFTDRARNYAFAYSLGGGVSYAVTPNLSLDLGYLYTSSPDAERARITSPTTYAIDKGFDAHEVKLGLRYALW